MLLTIKYATVPTIVACLSVFVLIPSTHGQKPQAGSAGDAAESAESSAPPKRAGEDESQRSTFRERNRREPRREGAEPDVAVDYEAMSRQMVARFDRDGDGKLSSAELAVLLRELRRFSGARPGQGGMMPAVGENPAVPRPRSGGFAPDPQALVDRLFAADADNDGKLSGDEIPERLRRILPQIDTNGDGAIDREEALAMYTRFQGMMRGQGAPGRGQNRMRRGGDSGADRPTPGGNRPRRPPAQ